MGLLNKILIANRGEIALRVIRSARKLAIRTVAIYLESENQADYVKQADEAVTLGNGDLNSTFLNIEKIIQIAISTGANAIHPGYGFLSENPRFAKACEEHQIIFIGPRSEVLHLMSSKPSAKQLAASLGIPVLFSYKINHHAPVLDENALQYPLLIKASYGGGGKGIDLVENQDQLSQKIEKSARIALNYFGNGELFIEQYLPRARHVEVQLIGDNFNNIIHLYERECSIQRNHQKIIEEAPASFLSTELREKILSAAIKLGQAVNYSGAGTVEFLVGESGDFFFMEMNPRIQVEHAVTEEVTGIDIVSEQIRVASGFPLSISQEAVKLKGHAIELRIYAENPAHNFTPSTIMLRSVNLPKDPNVRIESDIHSNHPVKNQFDPLLLKVIGMGNERDSAISLLRNQIKDLNVIGPETNTKYLENILAHPDFQQNKQSVEFCKDNHKILIDNYINKTNPNQLVSLIAFAIWKGYLTTDQNDKSDPWNYMGYWRLTKTAIKLAVDGNSYQVKPDLSDKTNPAFVLKGVRTAFKIGCQSGDLVDLVIDDQTIRISAIFENQKFHGICCENIQHHLSIPGLLNGHPEMQNGAANDLKYKGGEIHSPLHGKILEINIKENQIIKKGDLLLVIEAMKSENRILSPRDAKVKKIAVNVGSQVTDRMPLIFLEDDK